MADLAGMRKQFFDNQRKNITQDATKRSQENEDVIQRRFAALGQAGSGAQIGTTLKAQNDNAQLAQKAYGDLDAQATQAEMQAQETKEGRDFQAGLAEKQNAFQREMAGSDAALKREFFTKEQENAAKQMDLAERQFALDADTTGFNKRMAELEAGKEDKGLLGQGGFMGTGLKGIDGVGKVVKSPIAAVANPLGGCFLTTAACDVMGLADDCWVLESARKFRDEYMAKDEERAKEILEYYEIAPSVAEKISAREDSKKAWKGLFWKHIIPFVVASKVSSELAHELYKKLILKAKELAEGKA